MAKRKKLTSGEGWVLERAGDNTPAPVSLPPEKQKVRVALEKRGGHKQVTVISDLVLTPNDLKALAKQLKNVCGVGGTGKDDRVELQGDHRERIRAWLEENGWSIR